MPDYRRYFIPGGTYFFTLKSENNARIFADLKSITWLKTAIEETQAELPFEILAEVILPDHLHMIWSLPSGDADYPTRWNKLKSVFTKQYLSEDEPEQSRSPSRVLNRRRGVWQRKYWEHTIKNESDFERHFDYIHWNPVKHGYAKSPRNWLHSSFHRWVEAGVLRHKLGPKPRTIPPPPQPYANRRINTATIRGPSVCRVRLGGPIPKRQIDPRTSLPNVSILVNPIEKPELQ